MIALKFCRIVQCDIKFEIFIDSEMAKQEMR